MNPISLLMLMAYALSLIGFGLSGMNGQWGVAIIFFVLAVVFAGLSALAILHPFKK